MNSHATLLLAGGLAALVLPVSARDLRVRALSFQPGFPAEIHAHLPSGSARVGLLQVKSFLNHEANTLKFDGDALVFTRQSSPVSATDVHEHLATVRVPAAVTSAIFLFLPDPSGKPGDQPGRSRVVVVDDSLRAFPLGSFKVVNDTKLPVRLELEKEVHSFKAGETRLVAKPRFGENQAAAMRASCEKDGAWQMITSGTWTNPGTKRVLQLFTQDQATGRIEFKGIRDIAPQ
jgi:hypothetical protein